MARRDEFGANWWAKRWIAALEEIGWDLRLSRGRSYARSGRVVDIAISPGEARAQVKGSEPRPYRTTIAVAPFPDESWERIVGVLSRQALFAAKLLAGELPNEVADLCASAGAPLFPQDVDELATSCSCPDWVNPCKHVAAVHYVLAAEFDRDPFLLFRLRGRTREQLTAALRARRGAGVVEETAAEPDETPEPLEPYLDRFWEAGPELAGVDFEIHAPEVPAAILKRLGPPPSWGGQAEFLADLEAIYRIASAGVRELATGGGVED